MKISKEYEEGENAMLNVYTLYRNKTITAIYEPVNPYTATTRQFKDFEEGVIDCYIDFNND